MDEAGRTDGPPKADGRNTDALLRELLQRMERLERSVDEVRGAASAIPSAASAAVDALDERVASWQARGIDVDERLAAGIALVEELTEPRTLAALQGMAHLVGQVPGTIAMVADALDGIAARAQDAGIDIDERIAATLELGEKMTARATVDGLAGVLHPGAVSIVGMLGGALVSCYEDCMAQLEPRRYGPIKALSQLGDPDVQRGLAFLVNVARFFGRQMYAKHAELTGPSAMGSHPELK
jgi:hypothetical protein